MTGFDYVVIGIVALSLLFGLWRGVVGEIIALVAWVLAIFVAVEFGAQVGAYRFISMTPLKKHLLHINFMSTPLNSFKQNLIILKLGLADVQKSYALGR